jgi:protein TonB
MDVKKYSRPEVSNKRIDFFLIGLALSLLLVFGAFSYTVYDKVVANLNSVVIDEDLVVMENTVQEKKPPPPPPPPTLEVVEDDEVIPEQPEFDLEEPDQDTKMEEYEAKDEEEPEETDEVMEVFSVQEKAMFPGDEEGLQRYLAENIKYPPMALDNEKEGTVTVMFVVDKTGKVRDVTTLGERKGFGLEDEAMRVIRSTSGMWKPAKQQDKPVSLRFRIPVKFQIF